MFVKPGLVNAAKHRQQVTIGCWVPFYQEQADRINEDAAVQGNAVISLLRILVPSQYRAYDDVFCPPFHSIHHYL